MKAVRLFQVGNLNGIQLTNLAVNLRAIQDHFTFEVHPEILEPPSDGQLASGAYSEELLLEFIKDRMRSATSTGYPIGICELALGNEELFQCSDADGAIISIHNWRQKVTGDVDRCLQFIIAACLLDLYKEMPVHAIADVRACPSDYCDDLADLKIGFRQSMFCSECRRLIISKLGMDIPLAAWVAVQRILDNAANRPYCCILSPFGDELKEINACIRQVAAEKNYLCERADDIPGSRDILEVVKEMVGRAELIIAVLTKANPNVLFEVGYIYGIKKEERVVLLLQRGDEIPLYFKARQVLLYDPVVDVCERLGGALRSYF
ncbi:MAG: hypothetical protein AB1483_05290 [Candidatus Zixiibacteriota bacterium]